MTAVCHLGAHALARKGQTAVGAGSKVNDSDVKPQRKHLTCGRRCLRACMVFHTRHRKHWPQPHPLSHTAACVSPPKGRLTIDQSVCCHD